MMTLMRQTASGSGEGRGRQIEMAVSEVGRRRAQAEKQLYKSADGKPFLDRAKVVFLPTRSPSISP